MRVPLMLMLILSLAVAACGSSPSQEDRMLPQSRSAATTDQAMVDEALRFGGIVLPPSATVLGVDSDKGMDQLYTMAVEIDPGSVTALLSESRFTTPLRAGRKVFMPPVDGFDPDNATDIASAQDRLPPEDGRTHTVTREILVDRSTPAKAVVHIWLFTT